MKRRGRSGKAAATADRAVSISRHAERRGLVSAAVVIAILVGFAFFPAFSAEFVQWDDFTLVVHNQWLNPPSLAGLSHFWTRPHEGLYTPLAYTLWTAVAAVAPPARSIESAAIAFHAVNVLLHLGACVMVLLLLHMLTRNVAASAVAAAIFAVHPLQTEAVSWVSGMNNVLGGALSLAALCCYVKHAQSTEPRIGLRWYTLATALFSLALLSKPTTVGVPIAAMAIDLLLLRRTARQVAIAIVPWLFLAAVLAIVTRTVQPAIDLAAPSVPFRGVVALDAMGFYIGKLFWPVNLCMDYGRTPRFLALADARYFSWLAPVIVLVAAVAFRNRCPNLLAGAAIAVATLLPVLGLTPFDFQRYSTVADRYMYLPMAGVAVALAGVLSRFPKRTTVFVGGVVCAVLSIITFMQATHWKDTRSLLARGVEVNPNSLMANRNLAAMFLDAGKLDQAQEFARRVVELHPQSADAHLNAAAVSVARDDLPGAIAHYEAALKLRPGHPATHYSLAGALAQTGQLDRALEHARIAVQLDPLDAQSHLNLGTVLAQRGDLDAAVAELREAHRLSPQDVRAMTNLAVLLISKNQIPEAVALLRRALEIDPKSPAANAILRELGASR